ncbi:single myb histone 1-like isoform X2 [Primulina huaijiensis]|uniref:single myb histone 1-like isoform X2 n=1 Tax=Primulina huaijiensis TaxID=1492673 RepID=UPI003CC7860B
MGAPKQKWTSEEEAALKAGIQQYGVGKWSIILKDVEFSRVLRSRSNVDLKDKWRNLNCMTNGLGSRHRARTTHKKNQLIPKREEEEEGTSQSLVIEKDYGGLYGTPVTQCQEKFQVSDSTKQMSRLDDLILEAVTKLKEPRGSSRHSIADYIEVRHLYRIAPWSSGKDPTLMHANGAKKNLSDAGKDGLVILTKAQIDVELEKMKSMTAKEAAAAAAQAVAEAEAAIAVAEAAVVEAEEAEAEAEAAHCVADAAQKALNCDISGFEIKWQ